MEFINQLPQIGVQVFIEREMGDIIQFNFDLTNSVIKPILVFINGEERFLFVGIEVGSAIQIVKVRYSIDRFCKFGPKTVAEAREIMDENQAPAERALAGMHPDTKLIEEPDLLSLTFNARSPYKLIFQKFLFVEVLPKLRSDGFYGMPGAIFPQPHQQAIGYQRQPHKLEYADCVREGIEGTPESKLERINEKMTEC